MSKVEAQLAKGALRITVTKQDEQRQNTFYKSSVVVGRPNPTSQPDLDLSFDNTVSRTHARIWIDGDGCWIEDLGSKFGTRVNGEDIRARGNVRVDPAAAILIGDTPLRVEWTAASPNGFIELLPQTGLASTIEIDAATNKFPGQLLLPKTPSGESVQTDALLLEILVQFSIPCPLDQLLQTIIGRVVELISGAKRGTLLLCNPANDGLLLTAFVSSGEPAVSETLARRALREQQAFVWNNLHSAGAAVSVHRHQIQSGMYAPLIYDGRPLGVMCVDNPESYSAFSETDLQLLVIVADHAAVAVSHHQLREKLKHAAQDLSLSKFPPSLRPRLLDKQKLGLLHTTSQQSEATFLHAELRGFKDHAARLAAPDVQCLLNDYFAALTESIHQFDGVMDRFTGDTIFGVFGCPDTDPARHEKAIRAAWSMKQRVAEINHRRTAANQSICEIAISIHSGEIFHGFIGPKEQPEFTVLGKPLEICADLCHAAQPGEILLSDVVPHLKPFELEKATLSQTGPNALVAHRLKKAA